MSFISLPNEAATLLIRHVARMHGRAAHAFSARISDNGAVHVSTPFTAASYPCDGWLSRFCRHLCEGRFDEPTGRSVGANDLLAQRAHASRHMGT